MRGHNRRNGTGQLVNDQSACRTIGGDDARINRVRGTSDCCIGRHPTGSLPLTRSLVFPSKRIHLRSQPRSSSFRPLWPTLGRLISCQHSLVSHRPSHLNNIIISSLFIAPANRGTRSGSCVEIALAHTLAALIPPSGAEIGRRGEHSSCAPRANNGRDCRRPIHQPTCYASSVSIRPVQISRALGTLPQWTQWDPSRRCSIDALAIGNLTH